MRGQHGTGGEGSWDVGDGGEEGPKGLGVHQLDAGGGGLCLLLDCLYSCVGLPSGGGGGGCGHCGVGCRDGGDGDAECHGDVRALLDGGGGGLSLVLLLPLPPLGPPVLEPHLQDRRRHHTCQRTAGIKVFFGESGIVVGVAASLVVEPRTCTLASVRSTLWARSSLVKTSG